MSEQEIFAVNVAVNVSGGKEAPGLIPQIVVAQLSNPKRIEILPLESSSQSTSIRGEELEGMDRNPHGSRRHPLRGRDLQAKDHLPPSYPSQPPSVYFLSPTPRHEHVYTNGDICLSLLGKDWRPTMTAQSLAVSILSILSSAREKGMPMDNARHAGNRPGGKQDDWVYHDDNC